MFPKLVKCPCHVGIYELAYSPLRALPTVSLTHQRNAPTSGRHPWYTILDQENDTQGEGHLLGRRMVLNTLTVNRKSLVVEGQCSVIFRKVLS